MPTGYVAVRREGRPVSKEADVMVDVLAAGRDEADQ
jgi:hypothetical protein